MKRFLVALVAVGTLILSGCSSTLHLVPGSVVNIAETSSLLSLNADLITSAQAEHFADELGNLTNEQFYQLDELGSLVANTGFGTVTVDKTSPLTVTYEVATGRKWSDGQPVDSADLLLSYAAATNPGEVRFYSRRAGNGLQYGKVTEVGLRSITIEFSQPVSDYKTALRITAPAHVIAAEALNGETASAGKAAVIEAVQGKQTETLAKFSNAYRDTYWVADGKLPQSAFVTEGAYVITDVIPKTMVTLTANKKYHGDFPPVAETVNLRLFSDSMAALSDMNSGGTDIISASESGLVTFADLVNMVPSLTDIEATSVLKNGSAADMVLFNFRDGSVFTDAKLRQAFMHLIPKARIVQAGSSATVVAAADSFVYPSSSDFYSASVAENGSVNYLLQDVEKSSELVNGVEIDTPIDVRVVYEKGNPRSAAQFKAISERAASAGFNLIDASSDNPSRTLLSGEFDVVIGPRDLVGVAGTDPQSLIADPITGYQDAAIAKLLVRYASASKAIKQAELLQQIDTRLYSTFYGLPLYQVPNLVIYNKSLGNIAVSPFGESVTWGYWTWSVSAK